MRRLAATLLVLLAAGVCASATSITLLYTNDLHLRFERLDVLGERIDRERAAVDGGVLLLDAGDALHDFRRPVAAVCGADRMIAWMNEAGYDAMALGNHDMYWGAARLEDLAAAACFPILCANLVPDCGFSAPFVEYTVVEIAGVRTLVIGLITSELLPYAEYPWLSLVDLAEAVRRVLADGGGAADLTIVLCHFSVERAAQLAEAVPEIDVFISGHSHEITVDPVRVENAAIVQSGAFACYLGRLRLDVDPSGEVIVLDHTLLETEETPVDVRRGLGRLFCVTAIMLATLALALF